MPTRPATIVLDQTETGRFRARLSDNVVEADTVEELLDGLRPAIIEVLTRMTAEPSGGPSDPGFDSDLDYVLAKNAELYRRLAR